MLYRVTSTYSNGYRCFCCARDWDYSEEVDSLEEALARVPVELIDGNPHPFNGDSEVTEVSVEDESGEQIACASTSWSTGFGKSRSYSYTKWSGYRPDSGSFEVVYRGKKEPLTDRTWAEVMAELQEEQREEQRKKAERDLEDAQKRLKHYS